MARQYRAFVKKASVGGTTGDTWALNQPTNHIFVEIQQGTGICSILVGCSGSGAVPTIRWSNNAQMGRYQREHYRLPPPLRFLPAVRCPRDRPPLSPAMLAIRGWRRCPTWTCCAGADRSRASNSSSSSRLEVAPRWNEGPTILDRQGLWLPEQSNITEREPSHVLVHERDGGAEASTQADEVCAA